MLDTLGVRPSRRLGQSFLADVNMARRVVDAIAPEPGGRCLEIGPGLGAFTFRIAAAGTRVVAVERDPRLAAWLREEMRGDVVVVEGDATRKNLNTLADDAWGVAASYEIASNLPYGISSVILTGLARWRPRLRRAVVMIQSEVADRLLAAPGSAACGSLTAAVCRVWSLRSLLRVPPTCFWPRPEVFSRLVELVPRQGPAELTEVEERWFEDLLRMGFGQRRKQMRSSLAALPIPAEAVAEALASVGSRPESRFEALSVDQMVELARILARAAGP